MGYPFSSCSAEKVLKRCWKCGVLCKSTRCEGEGEALHGGFFYFFLIWGCRNRFGGTRLAVKGDARRVLMDLAGLSCLIYLVVRID